MKTIELSICKILDRMDDGIYALPEFQRGYVWDRDKVKELFISLYNDFPCGTFLLWNTKKANKQLRVDNGRTEDSEVTLILDGQQRMTSIYGVMRGMKPTKFYDGNTHAFTGLYFNVGTEEFKFYNPQEMDIPDTKWISVSNIMLKKCCPQQLYDILNSYNGTERETIFKLLKIYDYEFPCYYITENTKFEDVIQIFDKVNSKGKRLSEADIAIATLCGKWDDARRELVKLGKSFGYRYEFDLNLMLRCLTVYITGKPQYKFLNKAVLTNGIDVFIDAFKPCANLLKQCLDRIRTALYLEYYQEKNEAEKKKENKLLASPSALMIMLAYLKQHNGELTQQDWDKLLYWYVHAFIWRRYAYRYITNLDKDLKTISEGKGIDGLIDNIVNDERGGNYESLVLKAKDFEGRGQNNSNFYSLLYMLTRINKSIDFASGLPIDKDLLAEGTQLQIHHIFPQSILPTKGYDKDKINTIANYALITASTNLEISNKSPKDYLLYYLEKTPKALDSNWIPTDPTLWEYENYEKFLSARRELLAKAANELLHSLNPNHPTE